MSTVFPWLNAPSERVALRVGDRVLTQRELAIACARHVEALSARGIVAGERVAVWTQPALETLVALVAQTAAGYVSVPVDPKLGEGELAHVLGDAVPRASVAADAAAVAHRGGAIETLPISISTTGAASLVGVSITGAPALVLYTSGTTGAPKGALITDRNIASNLDALARAWDWTADDVIVHALPVFHVHGLVLGLFGSLRRGGALRWIPRFAVAELVAALRDHGERAVMFAVRTKKRRYAWVPTV